MYILTHLNCTIKNERIESIYHLHLLHEYMRTQIPRCALRHAGSENLNLTKSNKEEQRTN
jgi:hypothetical protein